MATEVDICNLALSRIRASEIGSFQENSAEAIQCRILYPMIRDQVLTSYAWHFAKVTRALSLTASESPEWSYVYDHPNDCLRIHYVFDEKAYRGQVNIRSRKRIAEYRIPYEVGSGVNGSRVIMCNMEGVSISYTKSITDARLFDPLFINLLAWQLASELAIPLGGDSGKNYRDAALNAVASAASQAMSLTANENEDGGQYVPESMQAYGSGYHHDPYHDKPLR